MSDDPREATAGDGLSAERRDVLRRCLEADQHVGPWADTAAVLSTLGNDEIQTALTYVDMRALLDAHGALQAAREQLDEEVRASVAVLVELEQRCRHDPSEALQSALAQAKADARGAGGAQGEE